MAAGKIRIDQALVLRGLAESREIAQRLILAGEVKVGTRVVAKSSEKVTEADTIELKEKPRFVSRGGLKLEGALLHFGLEVTDLIGLDVGASTGGFTDCLLQRGAKKVYAFDVGTNQLVYRLRTDERVIARENFNCRQLQLTDLGEPADIAVMDLSFISLTLVLPAVVGCLHAGRGQIVCLIKPQFELTPDKISKGGIVRDPADHEVAIQRIRDWVQADGRLDWRGVVPSTLKGTDGNQEFLAWLTIKSEPLSSV
jgi:23S rRNA (cytidine1920-2'-O)/16S rRNA (cytidine1409-2'-O)-methyltransferase